MADKKQLSEIAIAAKIKAGNPFTVNSERERKLAYSAAKFAGKIIKTIDLSDVAGDKFKVLFCK